MKRASEGSKAAAAAAAAANANEVPATTTAGAAAALMFPIAEVKGHAPWWPWSPDSTYKLIAAGKLTCVRVGRLVFLRPQDLAAFVERHVVVAAGGDK